MNYDADMRVWVSDLDDYINIAYLSQDYERTGEEQAWEAKQEALEIEIDELGDISLFSGKSISYRAIYSRGVTLEEWRWTKHRAETTLIHAQSPAEIEAAFLKAILSLGRRYAIARYARLEALSFSSAITATFSHGIRALLYQFMVREKLLQGDSCRHSIQRALHLAASSSERIAYDKVGVVQKALHDIAKDVGGANAAQQLDKEAMREILALLRLHFSVGEARVRSASELIAVYNRYEKMRIETQGRIGDGVVATGRRIWNWKMRFMHPLMFYYPYSIRNSLGRFLAQSAESSSPLTLTIATNELCLADCGMHLMKEASKKKAKRNARELVMR